MNFYKHFLGDYARDTAHLSMLEHGAYRLMLDHYYATGKSLPADTALLYRICKANSKAERIAVDLVAGSFFPVNGDGSRHNRRADKELGNWEAQATVNRLIGKLGGRPKKTDSVNSENRFGSDSITESKPNANPNHSQKPEITKPKSKAIARSADASSPVRLGEGTVIESIPLVGERVCEVCESFAAEMDRLFPAVDVPQTLREIRAWNLSRPTRRKTPKGIEAHIAGWFQRVQNGGH